MVCVSMRWHSHAAALASLALAVACTATNTPKSQAIADSIAADAAEVIAGNADGSSAVEVAAAGAQACRPAPSWQEGSPVFTEVTEPSGLKGIQGARMGVLDVDGDGAADLLVRRGGGLQDFAKAQQDTWLLHNDGKGHFSDITKSSGLLQLRAKADPSLGFGAGVYCSGDVDNDGDLDVFVGRSREASAGPEVETSEVLLGDGKGHFTLGPEDNGARFAKQVSVPLSASFVDFDRDGKLDIWVVMNMASGAKEPLQSRLLQGDGSGRFVDVTKARGLQTQPWLSVATLNAGKGHAWSWAATACDLNNDGREELMAASYGRAPNLLFRADTDADGAAHFTNASVASGYAYDDQMDWTTNWNAQCWCRDHPTDQDCGKCPKPTSDQICAALKASFGPSYRWSHADDRQPWRLGGNSGTTVCADVNNDGWFDLLTTEIVHSDVGSNSDPSELMVNLQDPEVAFQRPGLEATGLTRPDDSEYWNHGDITAAIYDFDNDGWQDVHIGESDYPGTYARLWRQVAPMQFKLLNTADYFKRNRGAGVVAADFDRDGDLDVVTGHTQMRCDNGQGADCQPDDQVHLHANNLGAQRNWLQIDLVGGAGSNRMAIGGRLDVAAGGVTQSQQVDGGHGQSSTQRDHMLHFGLGKACQVQATVTWPDAAKTQQIAALDGNRRYRWVQGQQPVEVP